MGPKVVTDLYDTPSDATPLAPSERDGLLQSWITFRRDLNEAEQANITAGTAWALRQRRTDILTDDFVRLLHHKMFGGVWAWAGSYRKTERNIGIHPARIALEVNTTLSDVKYWLEHDTYPMDEIAIRLHHRLVAIHPFANGNGRHTRLMADLLAVRQGNSPFTWGRNSLMEAGSTRKQYIAALRAADHHNIAPLLAFARS